MEIYEEMEMDYERYERDGGYAAEVDYEISYDYLLANVVSGFEAVTLTIARGGMGLEGHLWEGDYLETGLRLLGFEEASLLLKEDLGKCAEVFSESLKKKGRKEKLKRARGYGAAKGFGRSGQERKRAEVVEDLIKEKLDRGGKILFERNGKYFHMSVFVFPDEDGGIDRKLNLYQERPNIYDPIFARCWDELVRKFPEFGD
jgi:hypothetical protein